MDANNGKRARMALHTPGPARLPTQATMDTPMLLNDGYLPGHSGKILEYLQDRGGRIRELEGEVAKSKKRHDELLHELEAKHERIALLQQELAAAKAASISRTQLAGRCELSELERLLDGELSKSIALESQLHATQERLHAAEQTAGKATASVRQAQAEHARQLQTMKNEAEAAQKQFKIAQMEFEDKLRKAQLDVKIERRKREADQEIHRTVQKQLEELRAELAASSSQAPQAPSSSAILSQRIRQLEEALRAREAEVHALKSAGSMNMQKPECSISSIAAQQGGMAAGALADQSNDALHAELVALHARLRAWEHGPLLQAMSSASQALPLRTADAVSVSVEDAAAALKGLARQVTELKDLLASKDAELLKLSAMSSSVEKQCQQLVMQLHDKNSELQGAVIAERAAGRQLAAVAQERDALRRALAAPSPAANPDTVSGKLELAQQAARSEELQALVVQLQERVAALQGELAAAAAGEAMQRQAAAAAKGRADAAEARCVQLEKEADSLALDVATLQEKLGRGEMNRSSVRVLHFKMNPEAQFHREQADTATSELQTENQVLKQRLAELAKEVEESRRAMKGGAVGDTRPNDAAADQAEGSVHAVAVRDAQVAVLQHRLGELEKSMVRLKEVTKERIFAFREACYCLFGYRVDMTSEATAARDAASATTTFSLKPQHTDDPGQMLVFRYTKARGMELVPNVCSARMAREVETFIQKFNCIPAFTANLTMENFQKQTQC